MNDYPPAAFDVDVRRYLELDDLLGSVRDEMSAIKARLRVLGEGEHTAPSGVQVNVSKPNRSFSLPKAVALLNEQQLQLCKSDGYDAKKVKSMLAPVLLELCMDDGAGDLRVSVK